MVKITFHTQITCSGEECLKLSNSLVAGDGNTVVGDGNIIVGRNNRAVGNKNVLVGDGARHEGRDNEARPFSSKKRLPKGVTISMGRQAGYQFVTKIGATVKTIVHVPKKSGAAEPREKPEAPKRSAPAESREKPEAPPKRSTPAETSRRFDLKTWLEGRVAAVETPSRAEFGRVYHELGQKIVEHGASNVDGLETALFMLGLKMKSV